MERLINYLVISTERLVTHLGDFTTHALSQSYLVHYNIISNELIDSRGGKIVEHQPFHNNKCRFPKLSVEDSPHYMIKLTSHSQILNSTKHELSS